jgi:hypothetical protein
VESLLWHLRLRADVVEHAVRVTGFDEATLRGRENQTCVAPQRTCGDTLSELALPVPPQNAH